MPTPAATSNQEHAILQEVWRKGFTSPDGLTLPCKDKATATRMRFALYNAVKPVRAGKVEADSTLLAAINECGVSFTEDKTGLIIRKKVMAEVTQDLLALLGGGIPKSTEEQLAEERAQAFAQRMAEPERQEKGLTLPETASIYGARS